MVREDTESEDGISGVLGHFACGALGDCDNNYQNIKNRWD
ncbi:MAG: hypothetical protein ACJAXV_000281 [Bacteroidia bacterium]|jgi:hypothetical protein